MRKKLLALALILIALVNVAVFSVMAENQLTPVYAGVGGYTVGLEVDPSTNQVPSVFGTAEADGKVWTDKSVVVDEDHFKVTLSALSQEFLSVKGTENTDSTPADVVMILDFSGSMQNSTLTLDNDTRATRTKAMVKSVNQAMEIIMNANSRNRVVVYGFHRDSRSNSVYKCLFTLGHYTNPSWTGEEVWNSSSTNSGSGKYLNYSVSSGNGKVTTATGLKKDSATYSPVSESTTGGTCTQQGMAAGVSALISAISSEEHTVDRLPFVFLFTDGAPGAASKNWYSNTPTDQNRTSHYNDGDSEVTALSILSAAYLKDRLDTAYDAYNERDTKVEWFNIGLGVGDSDQGRAFMDPKTVANKTSTVATNIQAKINSYTSGSYSAYAKYAEDYIYADKYVFFAETGKELEDAFIDFGKLVEESSKEIKVPVLNIEGEAAASGLVFTDTLGKGMTVNSLALWIDDKTSVSASKTVQDGQTIYQFPGYQTKATLSHNAEGCKVLTWEIPSNEVAICIYKDRVNFTAGNYQVASPIRLVYGVEMEDVSAYEGERLYSNEIDASKNPLAYASFGVAEDNPYYYDVTSDSSGNFQSSSLKNSAFINNLKGKNITETAPYSLAYDTEEKNDYTLVSAKLGNNGRMDAVVKVGKSGSVEKIRAGEKMTFTVKVANKGEETITDLVVKDLLPEELIYQEGSVQGATASLSGQILTFTIPEIQKGATATITYDVVVSKNAVHGTVYENEIYLEALNGVEVLDPDQIGTEVTIDNQYRVIYEWSGAPAGEVLPVNDALYRPGDAYPVDQSYTAATKIEKKDAYGNLLEYWTFSGWTDPYHGVMGNEDVTIVGIWNHHTLQVFPHRVLYQFVGQTPDGVLAPIDGNTYFPNQPYSVDATYLPGAEIPTYDEYQNQNGCWTFSGWSDPNDGVMGNEDVTLLGSWSYLPQDVPSWKVTYEWSGSIPPARTLPSDGNRYVNGQSYGVDAVYTSGMTIDEKDQYGNVTGTYSFSGWADPNSGVMGNADVLIKGVWTYTEKQVPDYKVTYEWTGTIPDGKILPTDGNRYVPNQPYKVDEEFKNTTTIDTKDQYGNVTGTYSFSGWADPNSGVMGNADVLIKGVWTYTEKQVPDYKVTYTWSGTIPDGVTLPTDSNRYVPNQPYEVDEEYTAEIKFYTKDAYGNVTGTYSFSGWADPNSGVMGNADVEIPGVWTYTPREVPDYKVTYTWSGAIPDGVTLPTDSNRYVPNQPYEVDEEYTDKIAIDTKDAYGNITGTYAFSGWSDPNSGVMGNADVEIPGVWTYTPREVPEYKVTYTWSGTIPDGVTLPTDGNKYVPNQPYEVDEEYTDKITIDTKDAYGNITGTYTFSGWSDPNNGVMGNADVEIPGVWTYTPREVPDYKVTYTWSGTIPDGVTLPTDSNRYVPNQPYEVDEEYTDKITIDTKDAYGNITGTYAFSGWSDPNNGVMGNADVEIPGVWTYTPREVPDYKVTYTWSGTIPDGVTLPTDPNRYVPNQPYEVDEEYTDKITIDTKDAYGNITGTYAFSGWSDPNNGVMGNADVEIPGVWTYTPREVPDYKVTYTWSGTIPDGVTLPTDSNRYVPNRPYEVDEEYTNETALYTKDAYGNITGTYAFSGWTDPNSGVMGNADVEIPGVWTYTPREVPDYKVTYTWSGTIPDGVTLPTDSNRYVPNQPYEVDEEYTNAIVLYTKDAYGNITGTYAFSGWTDPNSGVMGNADVEIPGVWTYTPREVPDYKVTYTWSGTIPDGVTLPLDEERYVTGQPYVVDSTFSAETEILHRDENGKLLGVYTFSGWTDPNNGIMEDADIVILGEWTYRQEECGGTESEPENPPKEDSTPETPSDEGSTEEAPDLSDSPDTGDSMDLALWYGIALSSLLILIGLGIIQKKIK